MLFPVMRMRPCRRMAVTAAIVLCATGVSAQVSSRAPVRWSTAEQGASRVVAAATTAGISMGTNSAYAAADGIPTTTLVETEVFCNDAPQTILSVTIKRGKPKSVLTISEELVLSTKGGPWQYVTLGALINGFHDVSSSPGGPEGQSFCNATTDTGEIGCSTTAVAWVDLDAAEALHPGQFKGKPITLDLLGCIQVPAADAGQSQTIFHASMSVVMQRK